MRCRCQPAVWFAVSLCLGTIAVAHADPWIITSPVEITEPVELADVILAEGGSLSIVGVAEPGVRITGNLWAIADATVRLEDSVIQFMSTYHGQYALVAIDRARIDIARCVYRIPGGVQHGLVTAGSAELNIEQTAFDPVQLVASESSSITATRLDGDFEVIVQHAATMELSDIPRSPGNGRIWVWVEFPAGSEADYSPPLPGPVSSWRFPPAGAAGIPQRVSVEHCDVLLWPMLVREHSRLLLHDIAEDNWVVVGLHLPYPATIDGLENNVHHTATALALPDRSLSLVNSTVDTWNLYPEGDARVAVRDSLLGEILSFDDSVVVMENSTIDGSGGFFGARDRSHITASDCLFTTTVEAAQESTIQLHSCVVNPYPLDPTGIYTRFGAYDLGRLHAHQTPVFTTPALAGDGLIAVSYFIDPPTHPPHPGSPLTLVGSAAQYSLDGGPAPGGWRLESMSRMNGRFELVAEGEGNVENATLGTWSVQDEGADHMLKLTLTDRLGRQLSSRVWVLADAPRIRRGRSPSLAPGHSSVRDYGRVAPRVGL